MFWLSCFVVIVVAVVIFGVDELIATMWRSQFLAGVAQISSADTVVGAAVAAAASSAAAAAATLSSGNVQICKIFFSLW